MVLESGIAVNLIGQPTNQMINDIMTPSVIGETTGCVLMVMVAIGIILLISAVCGLIKGSASKQYRELLADMYIVGKTKKIAEEEGIDLIKELAEWSKIERKETRKNKLLCKTIDEVIANSLKEKIDAKNDELIDKIEEEAEKKK